MKLLRSCFIFGFLVLFALWLPRVVHADYCPNSYCEPSENYLNCPADCPPDPPNNPPSLQGVVINTSPVNTTPPVGAGPASTHYWITADAYDADGGSTVQDVYVIINHQGPNAGAYRGFLAWSDRGFYGNPATGFAQYVGVCTGGGSAGIFNGWGNEFITIHNCSTSSTGGSRSVVFEVSFNSNYTAPPSTNTFSELVYDTPGDGAGWGSSGSFDLNYNPVNTGATINSASVETNGTQYTITATTTDANGGNDIGLQYVAVNGVDGNPWRGYIGWTTYGGFSRYWGSLLKPGTPIACNQGLGGIYGDAAYGMNYINLIACSTSVVGNTRTTTFTISFNSFTTPPTNQLWQFSDDWGAYYDGWDAGGTFSTGLTPVTTNVTINSDPTTDAVKTDGSTQYTITMTATDGNGGTNITDQNVAINIQDQFGTYIDPSYYRGNLAWSSSSFQFWGGVYKAGTPIACSGGGQGAIYGAAGWGSQYVNLISCATSVAGDTRTSTLTVSFNTNFVTLPTDNYLSGFVADAQVHAYGWVPYDSFDLAQNPVMSSVTIAPLGTNSSISADGTSQYVITVATSDGNGGNDIATQYAAINGVDGNPWRGYIGWNWPSVGFRYWGASTQVIACTGGGQAGVNNDAGTGSQYINLISCTNTVSGNNRTSTFTVSFNTGFIIPTTGNRVWGWADNFDAAYYTGWQPGTQFNLAPFSVSGVVYEDANANGFQDCSGACDNGTGDERGMNGATVTVTGHPPATTNSLGQYIVSNVYGGTYNVTLTPITYYTATTSNPVQRTVGPNTTADFGVQLNAPTCTSVSATPSTIAAGDSSTVSANGCVPPGVTYSWPAPQTQSPPGNPAGSNTGGTAASTTYNAPTSACVTTTVRQGVSVTNQTGTNNSYYRDITITAKNTLSGTIYDDVDGNNCATLHPRTTGGTITVYNGAVQTANDDADVLGNYSAADITACTTKTAAISNITGFHVRRVNFDSAGWSGAGANGTYTFNFTGNHTLDWCVTDVVSWFETTQGDIRIGSLVNKVPAGFCATGGGSSPSVAISSSFPADLGNNTCPVEWTVNDEYSYNDDPKTTNGLFSYTFFLSRARIKNVTIINLAEANGASCDSNGCSLTNLATGIYKFDGNLTINSYTHTQGSHVTILSSGNIDINTLIDDVDAGVGNLLVVAAKGNITVDPSVGSATPDLTADNIEGVFTAEGSITLETNTNTCQDGVSSDKRLNLAGTFVSNALKPLGVGGAGQFNNLRSLCNNDRQYPVLKATYRPDFVTALTDFYKVPLTRWREVNP